MEKNKETNQKKALDKFSTEMLNMAINGINEAVANKQKEVDYWKRKAYILANKNKLCYQHEIRANEKNFNNLGVNFEYYISYGVDCLECGADNIKEPTTEEIINK